MRNGTFGIITVCNKNIHENDKPRTKRFIYILVIQDKIMIRHNNSVILILISTLSLVLIIGQDHAKYAYSESYSFIKSEMNGMVIGIDSGGHIVMYPQNDTDNADQLWSITSDGFIKNKMNDMVLGVFGLMPTDKGAYLHVDPQKDTDNADQLWTITGAPGFIKNKMNNMVLDILGADPDAGAYVIAYPQKDTDNANQLWSIVPESNESSSTSATPTQNQGESQPQVDCNANPNDPSCQKSAGEGGGNNPSEAASPH